MIRRFNLAVPFSLLLFLAATPSHARAKFWTYIQEGGATVVTKLDGSTTKAQRSCVGASVNFYQSGTTTLATIYDVNGNSISPTWTVGSSGYIEFYTDLTTIKYIQSGGGCTTRTYDNIPVAGSGATSDVVTVGAFTQAAITAACTTINSAGKGTLVFPAGTYPLYASAGGFICALSGVTGVDIQGHGATLAISTSNPDILTTTGYGAIFTISNSTNVTIDGFNVTGPDMTTTYGPGVARGVNVVQLNVGNRNISIPTLKVQGAQAAISLPNDVSTVTSPNRHIHIGTLDVSQSWYGVNGFYGIEDLQVDELRTDTPYRSLFVYGAIKGLRANVWSKHNYGNDVYIYTAAGHGVEDVELSYRRGPESTGTTDGTSAINIGFGDSTVSAVRNVRVRFDVQNTGGSTTGSGVLRFLKWSAVGVDDTTDRGHEMSDVVVNGYMNGALSGTGRLPIAMPSAVRWGSTLDKMYGIAFRDITLVGNDSATAIDFDAAAVRDTLILDHVNADVRAVRIRDFADATPTQTSRKAKIVSIGSTYGNQFVQYAPSAAYPIEVRNLDAAAMAIPAPWLNGPLISNIGIATDPHTNALPAAVVGMEATLLNESASAVVWRLDPNGTNEFKDAGTLKGAGKYLELPTGASARIRCSTTGVWEVLWSRGSIAYEP